MSCSSKYFFMIFYWVFGCSVQLTCSPSRHQNPRSMAHIGRVGYWVGQTWISPRILESVVPFLMTHRSPLPIGTSSLCWRSEKISQTKRSQIFKLIGTMYIYHVILCPSVCYSVCLFFCRFRFVSFRFLSFTRTLRSYWEVTITDEGRQL